MKLQILLMILLAIASGGPAMSDPASADPASPDVADHPWIGAEAPPFALESVNGESLALEDLRGRFVVIHFGTSW